MILQWLFGPPAVKIPFLVIYSEVEGMYEDSVRVVSSYLTWAKSFGDASNEWYAKDFYDPGAELIAVIYARHLTSDVIEDFVRVAQARCHSRMLSSFEKPKAIPEL